MKRTFILTGIGISIVFFCFILAMRIRIGHDSVLCQYEIHKALECIEHNYWWVSHPGLNK